MTLRRLLVIRLGALGDLVHVSPSVQASKAAHPDLEIHWLTSPAYKPLLAMMPGVDRIWTWDKHSGWPGWFQLAGELRAAGIDGVVNLHPSFKTVLLTQLLAFGRWPLPSAVYHKEKLRQKGQAQRAMARRHAVADFYQPFRRLLALSESEPGVPVLHVPSVSAIAGAQCDSSRAESDKLIVSTLPVKPPGERWFALIPGVGQKRGNRAWEPQAYQQLMTTLLETPTHRILLVGGPDEAALADTLMQAVGSDRVENHCGRHDIPGTAALLAQCDVVIGGDTGPLHLGAATGVPIIGIFGPTNPARTGPVGTGSMQSITPPDTLACWPCELPECPLSGDENLACMKQIRPDVVLAALKLP